MNAEKLSQRWFLAAVTYFVIGLGFGVYMGGSGDRALLTVHSHISLLGWASMGLTGLLYRSFPAAAQTNTTIVAGQSVGTLRIGGNIADALRDLGQLVERTDSRDGKYTVFEWPLRPHLIVAEKQSGRIVMIRVELSDLYKTDKGAVTGGSERSAVETAYGRGYTAEDDPVGIGLIYDSLGIMFDIGKVGSMTGRVVGIAVFVPGSWKPG